MKSKKVTSNAGGLALVMVGTVIGAGFASGAEINAYFVQYGEAGFWSMGLMGMLFFVGIYGTLKIAYECGCREYGAFTEVLAGKWLGASLDALVTFSMLLGYGVMLAGSDAVFLQQWGVAEPIGAIVMAVSCAIVLWRGAKGIVQANQMITPILIVGIILASIYSIGISLSVTETIGVSLQPLSLLTARPLTNLKEAVESATIYVSYNMLGASAVLVGLSKCIRTKREIIMAGAWAASILMALTFVLGLATFLNYDTIVNIPIPALGLLRKCEAGKYVYMMVLLGAMYTTALSNGFGFMHRIQAIWPIKKEILWLGMTVVALLVSRMGFADLVVKGYRILGYVGSAQLLLIVLRCFVKRRV